MRFVSLLLIHPQPSQCNSFHISRKHCSGLMAKPRPKEVMEWEAVNLIRTVTELQDEEENFEICERFVMSNLLYHKVENDTSVAAS